MTSREFFQAKGVTIKKVQLFQREDGLWYKTEQRPAFSVERGMTLEMAWGQGYFDTEEEAVDYAIASHKRSIQGYQGELAQVQQCLENEERNLITLMNRRGSLRAAAEAPHAG